MNIRTSAVLNRPRFLDHRRLEFSGFIQGGGLVAPPEFISEIGTLLPIAPCGRSSLYNMTTEHPRDRGSRAFVSVASLVWSDRPRP